VSFLHFHLLDIALCSCTNVTDIALTADHFIDVSFAAPPFYWNYTCSTTILPERAFTVPVFYQIYTCRRSILQGVAFAAPVFYWILHLTQQTIVQSWLCSPAFDGYVLHQTNCNRFACLPHHFTGYSLPNNQFYRCAFVHHHCYWICACKKTILHGVPWRPHQYWILTCNKSYVTRVCLFYPTILRILNLQQTNYQVLPLPAHLFTGYCALKQIIYQVLPCLHQHFDWILRLQQTILQVLPCCTSIVTGYCAGKTDQFYQVLPLLLHNLCIVHLQQINLPVLLDCTPFYWILHCKPINLPGVAFATHHLYWILRCNRPILPSVPLLHHHLRDIALANRSICTRCCLWLPHILRILHWKDHLQGVAFAAPAFTGYCACKQTNFTRVASCGPTMLLDSALAKQSQF